ncbi:MAG: hypothetical protein AAGC74_12300, partial [Verrucomicrobiota bacterium]
MKSVHGLLDRGRGRIFDGVLGRKDEILEAVRKELAGRLAALGRAVSDSAAAATDPDSKAESKYDTRSLEMSYLAAGQARQAE